MNNLIICGKANQDISVEKLKKNKTDEVWLCGTDSRPGADLYFEIHGIKVRHKDAKVVTKFDPEIYSKSNLVGLTVSNTISGELIYAWMHGYKNIEILGAPMQLPEYLTQRGCVVQMVDYLNAHGLNVVWEDKMATVNEINEKPAKKNEKVEKAVTTKKAEEGTVKVRILTELLGSYGKFKPGIYEIKAELAKQFIKDKVAEVEK